MSPPMATPLFIATRDGAPHHASLHPIALLVEHYRAGEPRRQRELDACLAANVANRFIDRIHLFTDAPPDLGAITVPSGKMQVVPVDARLTFEACFAHVRTHVADGTTCIVANADIHFDDTLALLKAYPMAGRAFALLRYDQRDDGAIELFGTNRDAPMYHPNVIRGGSQDAWIFGAPLPPIHDCLDFFVGGVHLCDSKINWVLQHAGLEVTNPCYSIRAIHRHGSHVRNRARHPACSQPPYFGPPPCHLDCTFDLVGGSP